MKRCVYLGLLAVVALTGCATSSDKGAWSPSWFASDTQRALEYHAWVRKQPTAKLAREYGALCRRAGAGVSDLERLRCAVLLSAPGTEFRDLARAQEWLAPVAKNAASSSRALASAWWTQFDEQRRVELQAEEWRSKIDALKSLEKDRSQRDRK